MQLLADRDTRVLDRIPVTSPARTILPELTLASGGRVAIITKGTTPYDADASVRMDGDVVGELRAVLDAPLSAD